MAFEAYFFQYFGDLKKCRHSRFNLNQGILYPCSMQTHWICGRYQHCMIAWICIATHVYIGYNLQCWYGSHRIELATFSHFFRWHFVDVINIINCSLIVVCHYFKINFLPWRNTCNVIWISSLIVYIAECKQDRFWSTNMQMTVPYCYYCTCQNITSAHMVEKVGPGPRSFLVRVLVIALEFGAENGLRIALKQKSFLKKLAPRGAWFVHMFIVVNDFTKLLAP